MPGPYDFVDPVVETEKDIDLGLAAGLVPEEEGRLLDLAKSTGKPLDLLRGQPKPILSALEGLPTRQAALAKDAELATWMRDNPRYAAMSHDDVTALAEIKALLPYWRDAAAQHHRATFGERIAATAQDGLRAPVVGIGQLSRGIYGLTRMGADWMGAEGVANWAADNADIGANLMAHIDSAATGASLDAARRAQEEVTRWNYLKVAIGDTTISAGDIGAGLVSLAPALLGGAFGIAGAAVAAGLQGAGGAYADTRERGDSVEKATGISMVSGIITGALTRFMPNAEHTIVGMLRQSVNPKATMRAIFARSLGKQAAGEMAEEAIDQFAQTILMAGTDTKNPKTWGEILSSATQEAVKAGLIGGAIGGLVGAGQAKQTAQVQRAVGFADQHAALAAAIDKSKTATRSKSMMQEFLQAHGMRDAAVHITGEDAAALLKSASAEERLALEGMGILPDSVDKLRSSGGSLQLTATQVHTADPAVRDKILEIAREEPSAPNRVEADELKPAVEQQDEERKASEKFAADLRKQEDRLVAEVVKAGGVDAKAARESLALLFQGARTAFLRNPGAAQSPAEFLKRVRLNKRGGMSLEEARQAITDMAGEDGKTALSQVSFKDLGQLSGRFDALTGQLELNPQKLPDTVALADVVTTAKKSALKLEGRTVRVPGQEGPVDAEPVVATLRKRVEAARRLLDCLN